MRHFESEKKLIVQTVDNKPEILADVRLRMPDILFDDYLAIDLGNIVVEIHHFGPGNTKGDTVVYVPEAKAAWTGNLVVGFGSIPPIFLGNAGTYLKTIARFAGSLEVETIIPGHGAPATGAILGRYVSYLSDLNQATKRAVREGQSLEETVRRMPVWKKVAPPEDHPSYQVISNLHRRNLTTVYRKLSDR
jgi:cyclase